MDEPSMQRAIELANACNRCEILENKNDKKLLVLLF